MYTYIYIYVYIDIIIYHILFNVQFLDHTKLSSVSSVNRQVLATQSAGSQASPNRPRVPTIRDDFSSLRAFRRKVADLSRSNRWRSHGNTLHFGGKELEANIPSIIKYE